METHALALESRDLGCLNVRSGVRLRAPLLWPFDVTAAIRSPMSINFA